MELALVDIRRGDADRYTWLPFTECDEFTFEWWSRGTYLSDDPHYVQALIEGVEVARVELDHEFEGSDHLGAPDLGTSALEIQFFEVARSHRRRGIGSTVIQQLTGAYPQQRLLAMSEEADEFWLSLGWQRYDHPDCYYRPLFVAPARSR